MELARLIALMADPRVYPDPVDAVEIHQTHISAVFLAGSSAYKIKKPVVLGFVDYGTLKLRRHWCEEELRLNRRLAPEVYLGVVPIAADGDAVRVEGDGPVVEWAVKMERLPEQAMLRAALKRGDLGAETIQAIARRIAEFHRIAGRGAKIAAFGRFDVVARNARENLEQSIGQVGSAVSACVIERLRAVTDGALERLRPCIEDRAERGLPCETHGDLRLDHVYIFPDRKPPGDLVIIDCIEFDPRFRAADPMADMAFLMMDLILQERRDLAHVFRDAYIHASGDVEGRSLVPFYVSYRAAVRAKVEGLKAGESEVGEPGRTQARHSARAHWLLALGELEEARRRPCLVLVGGLPGTGKSTLARELASSAGFRVIRSDQVRKELTEMGGESSQPAGYGAGIYASEWTKRTYNELSRRAEAGLFEGERILVDATFRDDTERVRFFELARRSGVPAVFLICQAEKGIVKMRLDARRDDVSDADWEIYRRAASRWNPLGPQSHGRSHAIDTDRAELQPLDQALGALRLHTLWD
jgi:aminoglycoside phosphotransferase family enzyme/predicted kinase